MSLIALCDAGGKEESMGSDATRSEKDEVGAMKGRSGPVGIFGD